jgi:hypothetical protein
MSQGRRRVGYTDENGVLLYQVEKLEPKAFRQRRPNGSGGWDYKPGDVRRVLYRLPELLQYPYGTVFVCEGEKDANRVADLEHCATTVAGGKWTDDCVRALTGRDVLILEDNDEAGRKKALVTARALHGTAATIRIVRLPGLPERGDVSDWLDAHPSNADRLVDICFETPLWTPPEAAGPVETTKPAEGCGGARSDQSDLWRMKMPREIPVVGRSGEMVAKCEDYAHRVAEDYGSGAVRANSLKTNGGTAADGVDANLPPQSAPEKITEPDYTLTIIQEDGGWVVCEGGEVITKPFTDRVQAERWLDQHRLWNQPWCCVCGSAVTRPDDPWEVCQMSTRSGADWMHKSCMEKFESWADDEARRPDREPGWQLIPNMEVLDSAWRKKLTKCTK